MEYKCTDLITSRTYMLINESYYSITFCICSPKWILWIKWLLRT